ncbi:MAG: DUF951 domain-containing protein [Firmicutes bacterium]|nr:DUF951 domain-containing protein [Bacillota bacterium]MBU4534129.1 DUF951 domain-containing protein [Bacillota bacterium]MBU4553375.1 DUF951 domain-containing protein [Bacillota bacterium]MDP3045563.1 DUF951 domain-containing protein [Bacillota bacterium]
MVIGGTETVSVEFRVGDIVRMKKAHPCGSDRWEVLRTGVDYRIRCTGCARTVLLPRPKFLKGVRVKVTLPD